MVLDNSGGNMSFDVVETDQAPAAIGVYSQAVKSGNTVYLSGQIPLVPETMVLIDGDINAQIRQVIENLQAVCQAAGGSLADIVKLNVYLTDLGAFGNVNAMMQEFFCEPFPARAAIGVKELPKGASVEMDAVMVIS